MQHLISVEFSWGEIAQAFAWGIVASLDYLVREILGQLVQVRLARQATPQPQVGVFDAALLPGGVGIAEEGVNAQLVE